MRTLLFVTIVLILFSVPLQVNSQSPIAEDSLLKAEATNLRPIDPVSTHPEWELASLDHYTYWISNGIHGTYGTQPEILLNSIPVDANFFGWQNLNLLPIYLPALNHVRSESGELNHNRGFKSGGSLEFTSTLPDSGLTADAGVYLGNESGDPGPWVYDSSRVTPNIDRWGPDAGGSISYGNQSWYARGVYVLRRHQQTDPISHRRIHRTNRELGAGQFERIQTNSQSVMFETGFHTEQWKINARGILAEDRNYLYLQPLGREVPSETLYRQLAIQTKYDHASWEWGMKYILDQKSLAKRNEAHDYVFDWNENNNSILGTFLYNGEAISLSGKAWFEHIEAKAPGLRQRYYPIPGFSVNFKFNENNYRSYSINTQLEIHEHQAAKNLGLTYRYHPSNWELNTKVYYSETLPIRQQSFGYWITRGYNFFEELGISINEPLVIGKNRYSGIQLQNTFQISRSLSITLNQIIIRHYELHIPWQTVGYSPNLGSTPDNFELTGETGTRFMFSTTLRQRVSNWLHHHFFLQYRSSLKGTDRYRNYFKQQAAGKLFYRLTLLPVQSFAVTLQGVLKSNTRWKEFEALDGRPYQDIDNNFPVFSGTYNSRVPAHLNINLGVKKWFWEERMSLQLTVQNLLNDETRLHPMGADRSFLFNIKATAGF